MNFEHLNLQLSELREHNSDEVTDNFDEPSGDNMEGHHSNDNTEAPLPVLDGGDSDTPVSSRLLLTWLADFEDRMTQKISCVMNRLVFQRSIPP